MQNGDFERLDVGWTITWLDTGFLAGGYGHSGSSTALYSNAPNGEDVVQQLNTIPGRACQLSFWLRTFVFPEHTNVADVSGTFGVVLEPAPAEGSVTVTTPEGDATAPQLDSAQLNLATNVAFGWTRYQVSFVPSASSTKLQFRFQMNSDPAGAVTWLLDDVSVRMAQKGCTDVAPHW